MAKLSDWDRAKLRVLRERKQRIRREITRARHALTVLLTRGPMKVAPSVIAELHDMSDAEVIALKYELRDFLRGLAAANDTALRKR